MTETPVVEVPRFYVIVPNTVQTVVEIKNVWSDILWSDNKELPTEVRSTNMVSGRLIAQSFHIGRLIENYRAKKGLDWIDTTAIVLSVRNTKELRKVSDELRNNVFLNDPEFFYSEYWDTNPPLYGISEPVHTATAIGPVLKDELDDAIGHLELYE